MYIAIIMYNNGSCMIILYGKLSLYRSVDLALSFYNSNHQLQAPTDICTMTGNGLNLDQKNQCYLQPDATLAIAEGALYGLQECSKQLSNRRWNCPHQTGQHFKNGLQRSKYNLLQRTFKCVSCLCS